MFVVHRESQEKYEIEIAPVSKADIKLVKNDFSFNWNLAYNGEVYAMRLVNNRQIIGLMSLKIVSEELRVEVLLLECSKQNIGASKIFEGIAGCLLAFACRLSFQFGFYGFISLVPKTRLIPHYIKKYGFKQFGKQLALDGDEAQQLIAKYLDYEK